MKIILMFFKTSSILLMFVLTFQSFAIIHTISAEGIVFSPNTITDVHIGDTVLWIWVSGTHTTTSTTIPGGAATWNHNLNSGSTSFEYIPTIQGVYNFQCNFHVSMGMIGSFTVLNPTDVVEINNSLSVKIYPNPFYDHVSFLFLSDKSFLRNLKIFDLTGRLSKEFYFPGDPSLTTFTLYLADLPSGIYLFAFIDNLNHQITRRVVRQ